MRFKFATRELETRVNQTDDEKSEVQVVNILPFPEDKSDK
jgi:hypothetical protein